MKWRKVQPTRCFQQIWVNFIRNVYVELQFSDWPDENNQSKNVILQRKCCVFLYLQKLRLQQLSDLLMQRSPWQIFINYVAFGTFSSKYIPRCKNIFRQKKKLGAHPCTACNVSYDCMIKI